MTVETDVEAVTVPMVVMVTVRFRQGGARGGRDAVAVVVVVAGVGEEGPADGGPGDGRPVEAEAAEARRGRRRPRGGRGSPREGGSWGGGCRREEERPPEIGRAHV